MRTVRFYTAHRLIDPPSKRRGNRVLYDYHHLLQLVTLKTLQAQYIPLRAVRRMMEGKSVEELENLISTVVESRSDTELASRLGDASKATVSERAVVYAPAPAEASPYPVPHEVSQFVLSNWATLIVDPKAAQEANVTEINRIADMVRLSLLKAYHGEASTIRATETGQTAPQVSGRKKR